MLHKYFNFQANLNSVHTSPLILAPLHCRALNLCKSELAARVAQKYHRLPFCIIWVLIHSKGWGTTVWKLLSKLPSEPQ